MRTFDKSKINKILIIKTAAIGDVLLSTPVIENLRHNFPDAKIVFLTQKYCKEVLTENPYLDRVLTYDTATDSSYCLIKNIREQRYDLVVDLFGNPRTALITFLSKAKYRVGYKFRFRSYAYNIKARPRSGEVHNIEFNLDALRILGLNIISYKPYFGFNEIQNEFANNFFNRNHLSEKNVIGINPGGTWPTKVWYIEKFAELINLLKNKYKILIFWGYESERIEAEKLKQTAGDNIYLIPEVDLKYMASLIKKCRVFITNDTGPMHIAWALGVRVAAIFGPTNSKLQGPLNDNSLVLQNESLPCLGCNLTK
ncbi:MAG: glycosyltransferase family 9 protein, partial [Ignavibacteria bacterium]